MTPEENPPPPADVAPEPAPSAEPAPAPVPLWRQRALTPRPLFSKDSWLASSFVLLAIVVPVVCVVIGAAKSLKEVSDRKSRDAIVRATRALGASRRPGDVIFTAGVSGDVHNALTQAFPTVLGAPSDALPLHAFSRAWIVDGRSDRGSPAFAGVGAATHTLPAGSAAATLHPTGASTFTDHLARAEVATIAGSAPTPVVCPKNGPRHLCTIDSFVVVQPSVLDVGGRRVECIAAHPTPKAALRVLLPAMLVRSRVVVAAALADSAPPNVSAVRVDVSVSGAAPVSFEVAPRAGFVGRTLEIPAAPGAPAGSAAPRDVELRFSVPGPGMHHFCFLGAAS